MPIDQAVIDAIPRHPADYNVAYGHNLDPVVIRELIDNRTLVGAIFRGYVPKEELQANVTPELETGLRRASSYFNGNLYSYQNGVFENGKGLAVMRFIGMERQGIAPLTEDYEPRHQSFASFLGGSWLEDKMRDMSFWPRKKMGEFGFHVLHAFKNSAENGLTPYWHTHDDITAHLTISPEGGVEWLPSHININDAKANPQKYEDQVQVVEPGDLAIMGRLGHRSPSKVAKQGQFAIIGGGPLVTEYDNS